MNLTINTNLADQIISVINEIANRLGIAMDYSAETILPYLQNLADKLVRYEIATSCMWLTVFVAGIVGCIIGIRAIIHNEMMDFDDKFLAIIGVTIVLCIPAVGALCQVNDIIKCTVFPEQFVFEYVKAMLSSTK